MPLNEVLDVIEKVGLQAGMKSVHVEHVHSVDKELWNILQRNPKYKAVTAVKKCLQEEG
jgi:hypothetical protein